MPAVKGKEIEAKVADALRNSGITKTSEINFEFNNGYLSLWGTVDVLGEKRAVENILRQIEGIRHIDNNLSVAVDRVVNDDEIARMVTEKMEKDPRINLHNIGVTVDKGVVSIIGNPDTLAEVKAAVFQAEGTYGVKDVVERVSFKNFNTDDATLTNLAETELSRSLRLSVRDIRTEAKDGIVYLHGTVDTIDQIEAAVQTIYRIKGVKEVRNNLIARHGESEGDTRLTNEVRNLLGQNGLGTVQAFVVNGILFLDGYVDTVDQKHKAAELVTRVEGLTGINNAIVVSS